MFGMNATFFFLSHDSQNGNGRDAQRDGMLKRGEGKDR